MSRAPTGHHGDWYEIRIQGRRDDLDLSHTTDGTTVLRGPVADQAALHGLLHKLRDLGLPLLSVTQTDPDNPRNPGPSKRIDPHPARLTPGYSPEAFIPAKVPDVVHRATDAVALLPAVQRAGADAAARTAASGT